MLSVVVSSDESPWRWPGKGCGAIAAAWLYLASLYPLVRLGGTRVLLQPGCISKQALVHDYYNVLISLMLCSIALKKNTHELWQEFLLDLLDSLPRLQLSDAHMSMVIFILKECGVPNVPSLKTFRRVQTGLRESVRMPTYKRVSDRGNIFYVNGIGAQVAKV